MKRWWRQVRAHWWFIRTFGPLTLVQYLGAVQEREREAGEAFDPVKHGERMLRAVGATEAEIAAARAKGLA